jgi:hypothetical protein
MYLELVTEIFTFQPIPQSAIIEKLVVAQLVKKFAISYAAGTART